MHADPREVVVRGATPADVAPLRQLLTDAGLSTKGVVEVLENFLVAFHDSRLVGSVGLERYGSDALLRSAAVTDDLRGLGVGHLLVERLLEKAAADLVRDIFLLTTTAEQWFPRFGFVRIGRDDVPELVKTSVEFREICPASAVVMVKHLS